MEDNIPLINRGALFSDESRLFRFPPEPDPGEKVMARFRASAADEVKVTLLLGEKKIPMQKTSVGRGFSFYDAEFIMPAELISYCYLVESGTETIYFGKMGCTAERNPAFDFKVTPGFHTPDWAKGAIFYQIYVDRFCNGNKDNDVETGEFYYINGQSVRITDWSELPKTFDVRCFYGGDLQGVYQKLDYLQNLGVEVIYLNPIFVSPSNHKYDAQDYDHIDPHLAVIQKDDDRLLEAFDFDNTNAYKYLVRTTDEVNLNASDEYFIKLVEEIHRRGMRIILDGVFNHCGSFNRWLDKERFYEKNKGYAKGAYVAKDSPYHDYFTFHDNSDEAWPYNHTYDGWWGHDTLPKLNYEGSETLVQEILRIGRKWVSPPFNCDGWRLDVAADLGHSTEYNHKFWKLFRDEVRKANPEAIVLAEHYGDASGWLMGDEWDTVMNYDAFMEPVSWFLTGLEKHSDEFDWEMLGNGDRFMKSILYNMSKLQYPSLVTAMNELSNHDHSRFLTRTNSTVGRLSTRGSDAAGRGLRYGRFRAGVVIQMTWPGAPTIYYGDEAGVVGWTDPDNRRTFPWGHEDFEMIEFHKYLIHMHKSISCLRNGCFKPMIGTEGLIAYGRFDINNQAVIIINHMEAARNITLPVWQLGVEDGKRAMARIMQTTDNYYNVGREKYDVEDGNVRVFVPAGSATILVAGKHGYRVG